MTNLFKDPFFIFGFAIITFQLFVFLIFLIFYFTSRKKEKRSLLYPAVKQFENQLKDLMEQEIKKIIFNLKKDTETFTKELIDFYGKEISLFPIKAQEQLSQMNKVSEIIKDRMLKEMENKIEEFSKTYFEGQDLLSQEIKNKTEQLSRNITEEIHWLYQASLKPVSEKVVQVEKNIDDYKKEKLKEVDQKIYQIIKQVAKITIGKTIDLSLHEKLVMEALEKAKRENFF